MSKEESLHELEALQKKQTILTDSFGRIARKLRISLTDRCNMRCMYCMPQGDVNWFKKEDVLNFDEILRLVGILTDLGIEKVRLTGGEPLLRPNLEDFVVSLKRMEAIKSISMTTNGLLLADKVEGLKEAARKYNLPVEVVSYDADHAFFNDTRPEVYNEAAAADAWQRTVEFLRTHLGQ